MGYVGLSVFEVLCGRIKKVKLVRSFWKKFLLLWGRTRLEHNHYVKAAIDKENGDENNAAISFSFPQCLRSTNKRFETF